MRLFACDQCQASIFFDNFHCVNCSHPLAYLPDLGTMSALELLPSDAQAGSPAPSENAAPVSHGASAPQSDPNAAETLTAHFASSQGAASGEAGSTDASGSEEAAETENAAAEPPASRAPAPRYKPLAQPGRVVRMCQNHTDFAACNWAVYDDDPEPLCLACRLNEVIPDLRKAPLREAWLQLEAAKRRLLYSLFQLRLPVEKRVEENDGGLAFSFMAGEKEQPVFTGHNEGLITINVAEADDPFREKTRAQLGEAYRTVLGHFRHEIGHYYWDRLIKDSAWLDQYRELFGDETLDYQEALERHYKEGSPPDWAQRFVSQYASMHPWEDWAETWAHYLHIFDTLETAKSYGLRVKVGQGSGRGQTVVDAEEVSVDDFEQMAQDWVPLTLALNSLNRSMGMRDLYPFVLTDIALQKLRFVHQVIKSASQVELPAPKPKGKKRQATTHSSQLEAH
jgi:hypothetical protein